FQLIPLHRSLTSCSGDQTEKMKKVSKKLFQSILCCMEKQKEIWCSSIARDVIQLGITERRLRDEFYTQIIKQTTENPNIESINVGFKLIIMCLASFTPNSAQ